MTVTSVAEMEVPVPVAGLLAGVDDTVLLGFEWLRPWAVDDDAQATLRIQALVVETDGRRIVVDTCVGNDKERAIPFFCNLQGAFLADLAAAGYPRESIDTVICTHLHSDHVGWNTMLVDGKWVPTFPNARYVLVRAEVDAEPQAGEDVVFVDSVQPILDAGVADLVEPGHVVCPGITLLPTPGHTPGHVSVLIESGVETAVITGDVMHHPVQCGCPHWPSVFDNDPAAAEATRRRFLDQFADRDVLIIGTHFPLPGAGHIRREEGGYSFRV